MLKVTFRCSATGWCCALGGVYPRRIWIDASQDLKEVRLETDEVLQICGYYTLQQCCCLLSRQQAVQSTSCTHTTLFPNKFTHDLHFILKKDYKACGNNDKEMVIFWGNSCIRFSDTIEPAGIGKWLRKHHLHMWQDSKWSNTIFYVASGKRMANPQEAESLC